MKNKLQEIRKAINNKELTREEVLLSLFTDEEGDLYLFWLNFNNFEGNVWMSGLKVKDDSRLNDNLCQSVQRVKGDYYATSIKVKDFQEPTKMVKKITLEELKEMGYELEE